MGLIVNRQHLAIVITTLGINLFGDGLRDVLDPHRVLSQPGARMD